MKTALFILPVFLAVAASAASAGNIDYSKGIFIVNEDWYGHNNSSVNYLEPDAADGNYWHYRVIQQENPGRELGCTNQFGAIWHGRFYLIAKQDKDNGATVQGGRITVCDASTMKILYQSAVIDPSGAQCDGRGFVGVDEHKGYISTSNGVWTFNLDNYTVGKQVEGSANPSAGDTGTGSSLYQGQCGSMVLAAGRVFAAHQQYGLLVIDPKLDKVTHTISTEAAGEGAGIGSVVLAKDGSVWLSIAKDTGGSGSTLPKLIRVDPLTLGTKIVDIPDGFYPPSNSWYAWTPDSFCASSVTNSLYWCGGKNTWFSGKTIFRYDIDTGVLTKIIDLDDDGENWQLYGCSMRLHPVSDEIYMSLYHGFTSDTYITRRYSADGIRIKDYPMINSYWFPSLPVFPEQAQSDIADIEADSHVRIYADGRSIRVDGTDIFSIYDTAGRLCPSERLSPGLYIVVTPLSTSKILIK